MLFALITLGSFFIVLLIGIEHFVTQTARIMQVVIEVLQEEAKGNNEYLSLAQIACRSQDRLPNLHIEGHCIRSALYELFEEQRLIQCRDFFYGGSYDSRQFKLR